MTAERRKHGRAPRVASAAIINRKLGPRGRIAAKVGGGMLAVAITAAVLVL